MTALEQAQAQDFRDAMSRFPSGVTIVTTVDSDGRWWGFTATSFCSVSANPRLVLVCLAETAECHPVFAAASRWTIHIVGPEHADLAVRFATRGADKFGGGAFVVGADGVPVLEEVSVRLDCVRHDVHGAGDHVILLGRVVSTHLADRAPAVYFQREFHPCEFDGAQLAPAGRA